jgi:hypothetical protein
MTSICEQYSILFSVSEWLNGKELERIRFNEDLMASVR